MVLEYDSYWRPIYDYLAVKYFNVQCLKTVVFFFCMVSECQCSDMNYEHSPSTINKNQFNTLDGAYKSFNFSSMFLLFHFLDSNGNIDTVFAAI